MATHQETIDRLSGRANLSALEMRQLVEAKRATRPADETTRRDGWVVTVSHHVHTGGHWSSSVNLDQPGTDYAEERTLYVGPSEADCRAAVDAFFASETPARVAARWAAYRRNSDNGA